MDTAEYLRKVPKVELHCHFEGTVRAATFADLASKHDVKLPTEDVGELYSYTTIVEFLEIFRMVSSTIIDREDFARSRTSRSKTASRSATSSIERCSSTRPCTLAAEYLWRR